MLKPALRIGVLTLCPGDEAQLDTGALGDRVKTLIGDGTLGYTPAPDNWVPFDDSTPIFDHLTAGLERFQLYSDSGNLGDSGIRRGINLFVIDPLVLLHPAKAYVAALIQEHVCSRSDKALCIVIRSTLPGEFFNRFAEFYLEKFKDLMDKVDGLVEYQANDPLRLKDFLRRRVAPSLGNLPDALRIAESSEIFAHLIGKFLPAMQAPVIGTGTRVPA